MTEFKKEDVLKGIERIINAVGITTITRYFQSGGKEGEEKSPEEKPIDEIVTEICNEKRKE